ncbi:S-adenosylmethionine:tRNA ribosyltransferase-isomerase [Tellurirhabdus bombi]|uniref:S-adenosylmethionine:tRNA ribosyltransferase-isomerase n=1 Tax=Tellurirhabdus bombi TaxID=2907205 RepID=UPI001F21544A|nr:S-adenosylmethionine:tRNA ribosyltransferase-isomerase [Tellurirhabdus bombi]
MEELSLHQFEYDLPDERIARFPLAQRDHSKLLVYRNGEIAHQQFQDLPDWLPEKSLLVFNNTKVIPARLHFQKPTGALIELFLLNPIAPESGQTRLVTEAMSDQGSAVWECMVGNRKRWKEGEVLSQQLQLNGQGLRLTVSWQNAEKSLVRFDWTPESESFAAILHEAGKIPLPPYLKREAIEADKETYQTVYSKIEGAVAAPTAGLHFTPAVLASLANKGFAIDYLTLHVGAGTFQPIKADNVRQHVMHAEQVVYSEHNLKTLLDHSGPVIPVGTTSMRSLESLYWFGVRILKKEQNPFVLDQQYAYGFPAEALPSVREILQALLTHLKESGKPYLTGYTSIYIVPGYQFRICKGIVTNFHQPGSTLIVLISALIGDKWRSVYQAALENDYRFLSYGDSSLLIP